MCGRRKIEREYPELVDWGDMDYELAEKIAKQIPENIVVQFHNNGEPLLYPRLGDALRLFTKTIRCFDTNGKLLMEKAEEIIDNLETLTISTFENDPEHLEQWLTLRQFMQLKGARKPNVIARRLGNVPHSYEVLGIHCHADRVFHSPMGSFNYQKKVTIPEIGICWEALHHLSIDRQGKVSMCVRFDPKGEGIIGDANTQSLTEIWNGNQRKEWLTLHIGGKRQEIPICSRCDYWGIPISS